eukprot:g3617.t1
MTKKQDRVAAFGQKWQKKNRKGICEDRRCLATRLVAKKVKSGRRNGHNKSEHKVNRNSRNVSLQLPDSKVRRETIKQAVGSLFSDKGIVRTLRLAVGKHLIEQLDAIDQKQKRYTEQRNIEAYKVHHVSKKNDVGNVDQKKGKKKSSESNVSGNEKTIKKNGAQTEQVRETKNEEGEKKVKAISEVAGYGKNGAKEKKKKGKKKGKKTKKSGKKNEASGNVVADNKSVENVESYSALDILDNDDPQWNVDNEDVDEDDDKDLDLEMTIHDSSVLQDAMRKSKLRETKAKENLSEETMGKPMISHKPVSSSLNAPAEPPTTTKNTNTKDETDTYESDYDEDFEEDEEVGTNEKPSSNVAEKLSTRGKSVSFSSSVQVQTIPRESGNTFYTEEEIQGFYEEADQEERSEK